MNKKNKLTILSIITSSIILTSNIPINHTSNFYTSKYYDIPQDNIINELTLADENQNFIPEDNYIPQGIAIIGTDIIISSFDFYKEKNSILCIYNEQGQLINKCTLEHKAHVGGIAYDSINNLLWVTAQSGNIIAYDIDDIYNKKHPISKCKEIYVGENLTNYLYPWLTSASFLTVYNNEIFVGNFSLNNVGTIKIYKIESTNDNITLNYVSSFKIPNKVQGITFYKKCNQNQRGNGYGDELMANAREHILDEMFDDMCWEVCHIKRKAFVKYKFLYLQSDFEENFKNN